MKKCRHPVTSLKDRALEHGFDNLASYIDSVITEKVYHIHRRILGDDWDVLPKLVEFPPAIPGLLSYVPRRRFTVSPPVFLIRGN